MLQVISVSKIRGIPQLMMGDAGTSSPLVQVTLTKGTEWLVATATHREWKMNLLVRHIDTPDRMLDYVYSNIRRLLRDLVGEDLGQAIDNDDPGLNLFAEYVGKALRPDLFRVDKHKEVV